MDAVMNPQRIIDYMRLIVRTNGLCQVPTDIMREINTNGLLEEIGRPSRIVISEDGQLFIDAYGS